MNSALKYDPANQPVAPEPQRSRNLCEVNLMHAVWADSREAKAICLMNAEDLACRAIGITPARAEETQAFKFTV